jgi:hypothetical protein
MRFGPLLLLAAGCAAGPAVGPDPAGAVRVPGARTLQVFVDGSDIPLLGESRRDGADLVFEPRFPFKPGLRYRAVVDGAPRTFDIPAPPPGPSTELLKVFPTSDVLPENQLKFYLQFSAPMARGEAYRRVALLEGGRRKVELPFLEIGEELWDRSGTRLTLLFDPGRIKSGLKPREEEGPALENGKSYVLVVDGAWRDAAGRPLREGHRKAFHVGPPDETQPDPKRWAIDAPRAGTSDPLTLRFDEPLDAGLLARVLDVEGLDGRVEIDQGETRWRFFPAAPWKAGAHAVVVDVILEDRAGNNLERPFEVDVVRPVEPRLSTKLVRLPFTVD